MLNTEHPSFWLACLLAIASGGVYLLRFARPAASREYDVIFAVAGLIYAIILGWEGWRLIPLLFLAQILVLAIAIFFTVETFRLRGLLVDKARRSGMGGVPPGRRGGGGGGFNRTYQPNRYDSSGRPVSARRSNRMRNAEPDDADMPRSRKLKSANRRRPQLASATTVSRSRRPTRSTARPPVGDDRYDNRQYADDADYDYERDDNGYGDRFDRNDSEGRSPRSNFPRQGERPVRRPSASSTRRRPVPPLRDDDEGPIARPTARRRPPSIPDDADVEPPARRTISVDAGQVESDRFERPYEADVNDFDAEYDDDY